LLRVKAEEEDEDCWRKDSRVSFKITIPAAQIKS